MQGGEKGKDLAPFSNLVLCFTHVSFLSLSVLGTCYRICCDVLNLHFSTANNTLPKAVH